jgi:N-acetylglucosaminyl-diphospho-decaprenol L-rhamnosyltransferase
MDRANLIMKLSVVILCWNDRKIISDCLASIYATTRSTELEVLVSDNGSTDGSVEFIRKNFPQVRLIENGRNLRFAKGNNVAIRESRGEYVLILNPDTIIHDGTLDKLIEFADAHPETGAFGCRVLNADGTYQMSVRPTYTTRSEWCLALGLRPLARFSDWFQPGEYVGWHGETVRTVGWVVGCFLLVRGELLKRLGGFDEQFFYYYEDQDLCRRVWEAGYPILFTPHVSITHLGGQSTQSKFPALGFAIDSYVTRYLYYFKYEGARGARNARRAILSSLFIRLLVNGLLQIVSPTEDRKKRQELRRALLDWNYRVDPVRLGETGEEPEMSTKPAGRVLER